VKKRKRYVQERAMTTLGMVADASEATLGKVRFSFSFCVLGGLLLTSVHVISTTQASCRY
jgi:hypothetical protein